jgi:hypothetical protein
MIMCVILSCWACEGGHEGGHEGGYEGGKAAEGWCQVNSIYHSSITTGNHITRV